MPLDFLSVKQQAKEIAAKAPGEAERLGQLHQQAAELLEANAERGDELRAKVEEAARADSWLRSAKPAGEALTASFALPASPGAVTLIAADGSQIDPSRHEAVNYYLVNLGAIIMRTGSGQAPVTKTVTQLHFAEYGPAGSVTGDQVALERDKGERAMLATLAVEGRQPPVITLTDGPLELWGGRNQNPEEQQSYLRHLEDYIAALEALNLAKATTAGYVDKPRADLVVRALEVAMTPVEQLGDLRKLRPLRGVTDATLLEGRLAAGERSAIFALQTQLAPRYAGPLGLHFFYLNVGSPREPWLARVEVPARVAQNAAALNALHAILIEQCGVIGAHPYPYILHRAHEIAVVSRVEKDEVTQMLLRELAAQGITAGKASHKQAIKDLPGRGRS